MDPDFESLMIAEWDSQSKAAEVKSLRRAPVKELFEMALKARGDEREELKTRLTECLSVDVWEVAKTPWCCSDADRRALAVEITGTRYTEDGGLHEYHGERLNIHTWPGHLEIRYYGGMPRNVQDMPSPMRGYNGPKFTRDEDGLRRMVELYESQLDTEGVAVVWV